MPVRIKICGLSTPDTIAACAHAGASHIGFNFYPPSPRFVSAEQAAKLSEGVPATLQKVGVFVDADDAFLAQMVEAGKLDAIQLHGKETPARAAEVCARFDLPVWKVLSVENEEDIAQAAEYSDTADFLLFDAKTPKGSALPGGMGHSFDWNLLKAYHGPLQWGLAGGLTADNVAEAINATGAQLVDTSSGVESAPGIKDAAMIETFCKAALS
ncbi:phosphoribosylanthranilate isomerase [Erythrobacter sp. SCSIO 43205]|uniref:phosphoribosylanthranilate isomerase n=1 Tax=Erythrobacter sp. SCSIO 43205 TaxID=2779361 RepID=UPI001CAA3C1E|nr:phosphoribosylanthranilate isomerase [Erythrobacter sp. SCSIO 43205]UAB77394.1 phosphoribosylanthranilate isomerase [Erythrobacter sp. SCSIO 43205]